LVKFSLESKRNSCNVIHNTVSDVKIYSLCQQAVVQDEYTSLIWSYFLSAKSELAGTVITSLKTFQKKHNINVKFVRMDNAVENKTFQQEAEMDSKLNLIFEVTAPYTPQQNGKIERKFTTIWGKLFTMLSSFKLQWNLRNKLWAQCANLATPLKNIICAAKFNTIPYDLVHDS
jgi:transposase InsO family protein